MAMDFFLAGDGATRRGEGCSGLERPLARFELEKSVSRRNLTSQSPATLSYVAVTNAPPTTVNLSVFISLYLSLSGLQQQMQKRLNFSISSTRCMVRPNYAGVL